MEKKEEGGHFPKESVFLSDKSGGYFALDGDSFTQYQGLIHFLPSEWELYKTIEDIRPKGINAKSIVVMQDGFFEKHTGHVIERFWFSSTNLIYEIHGSKEVSLQLDFRKIHDYDDKGRIYNIYQEKDMLIIEYKKYDDLDLKNFSYSKFLVLKGVKSYELVNKWIKKNYAYDELRNSKSEFYVYDALTFILEDIRIVFGFGSTKKEAIDNANKKVEINIHNLILDTEIAAVAMSNLIVNLHYKNKNIKGIIAGLPWFYQLWGRDEAISLIGLITAKEYAQTKEIMMRLIESLDDDGCLHNRWPESMLKSADATGWLFKRIHQFFIVLERENKLNKLFSSKELNLIFDKISRYAKYSLSLIHEDLIVNKPLETWMDTMDKEGKDVRSGARIEIQALHLAIYALGEDLVKLLKKENATFTILKDALKEKTRNTFFVDGLICDGYENGVLDRTLRPNVFLAYYIYPQLFSKEEWELAFDKVIDACFLDWGGFSTIDKNNYLFREEHTGMNNESYHRGDSWFFVNNISALCMLHLNSKKYHEYIKKIRKASVTEMIEMGFIGNCAEISSAKKLCSRGCLAQAWSVATLVELLHEYYKEK
ncbi:MAG: amylo-alpha-1,6-glucosidase [Candidatus Woesearchaeota archaeon]